MDSASLSNASLDQLQAMLNGVVEQTARVFADATRSTDKDRAVAAAVRLRNVLPLANDTFHNALDELEYELRMARWTLRRDLIRLRENKAAAARPQDAVAKSESPSKDVDMADAPATTTAQTSATISRPESALPVNGITEDSADSTVQEKHAEREPQTADSATMDFDSLFQDPDSADGSPAPKADDPEPTTTEASVEAISKDEPKTQPVVDADPGPESSLSSLLPGLEAYSNAVADEPNSAIDLSTPIIAKANIDKTSVVGTAAAQATGTSEQQQQQQPAQDAPQPPQPDDAQSSQQDTTFDDLMNFGDFDMTAFGDGTFEDGGGGSTFDDNFFNIE